MHAVGTRARADLYRATFDELLISLRRPPVIDRERIERPGTRVGRRRRLRDRMQFRFFAVSIYSCRRPVRRSMHRRPSLVRQLPDRPNFPSTLRCETISSPCCLQITTVSNRREDTFGATGATLHNAHVQNILKCS